jgi:hypothetical protein
LEQNQPLLCHRESKMKYLLDFDHVLTDSRCLHFYFIFLPFYLIGKLNIDLVGLESTIPLFTLFLWWVEVLFETRNICLNDMILVHKTSPEENFFFLWLVSDLKEDVHKEAVQVEQKGACRSIFFILTLWL